MAAWLEISDARGTRRADLAEGLTRLGSDDCEVAVDGAGADQLHVWDAPPRAIYIGSGEPPRRGGMAFEETALVPGDEVVWRGTTLVYREEVQRSSAPAAPTIVSGAGGAAAELGAAPSGPTTHAALDAEARAVRRLHAGLVLAIGAGDKRMAKRWQEAVVAGAFDPDRCAAELLEASTVGIDDPRVVERSGRLLRDFLMAPVMSGVQGAKRKAKRAARGGIAFLIAQGAALVVFSLIFIAALLLVRIRGTSIDELLDLVLFR